MSDLATGIIGLLVGLEVVHILILALFVSCSLYETAFPKHTRKFWFVISFMPVFVIVAILALMLPYWLFLLVRFIVESVDEAWENIS